MTIVHLVRHGRASAGWNVDPDPGLDSLGADQAVRAADVLAALGPRTLMSSPLRRCQETAAPLATRWSVPVGINDGVAEIPSPEGVAIADRVEWLRTAMNGTWAELGPRYTTFRDQVADTIRTLPADTIVFSHFIAINAIIGAALGDDRLVIRSLDNCSITVVEVSPDGTIRLVQHGEEADTLIR